jgi:GNAT superfamily N-acetyltransferase
LRLTEFAVKPPTDHLDRRDADPVRMTKFRSCISAAKGKWFNGKYGEKQIMLMNLATHPDYWRRGLGFELCRWGLDKAEAEGLEVTLFSSPMGLPLYTKLGFHEVGMMHCQVEGEEESIDLPVMEWGPLGEKSPVV